MTQNSARFRMLMRSLQTMDYLHAILQSLHKRWEEIDRACVSISICLTKFIIYSSALTLITGEKLCGRIFNQQLHHPPSCIRTESWARWFIQTSTFLCIKNKTWNLWCPRTEGEPLTNIIPFQVVPPPQPFLLLSSPLPVFFCRLTVLSHPIYSTLRPMEH